MQCCKPTIVQWYLERDGITGGVYFQFFFFLSAFFFKPEGHKYHQKVCDLFNYYINGINLNPAEMRSWRINLPITIATLYCLPIVI